MSERYQREIEEILRKSGDLGSSRRVHRPRLSVWRLLWLNAKQSLGGRGLSVSPGRVMLISIALLVSALIFRAFIPGMVGPLAWAGLLLFIVSYALFFIQPRGPEKRWRGQSLEGGAGSWWDRLRRKLR